MSTAVTYTVSEISDLSGVSTWAIYEAVKRDDCPFDFIRVGKRLVFPKASADRKLGIEPE